MDLSRECSQQISQLDSGQSEPNQPQSSQSEQFSSTRESDSILPTGSELATDTDPQLDNLGDDNRRVLGTSAEKLTRERDMTRDVRRKSWVR
nr:hypothetical protein L203_06568 [Cryptococcus depauperatus CBS 7841]